MKEMLTAKEVQDLLQVDRSTIYRMAEQARLPALKVGRQWRFPAQAIDTWLAAQGANGSVTARTPAGALADQLPLSCVQLLQDTYAEALGVMMVITDMEGQPVTAVSNACGFFAVLQHSARLWDLCHDHWQQLAGAPDLAPRFTRSTLGLLCARGLIRHGSTLKGMLFVGGLAPSDWPPSAATLQTLAAELDVPVERLQQHAHEVYSLDNAQQAHVLPLVQRIADVVSHILSERSQLLSAP